MNVLVIGGAGFIGSRLVKCLVATDNTVVCFDVSSRTPLHSGVRAVQGDVTAIDQLLEVMLAQKFDCAVNMAYWLGRETEARPHSSLQLNILGMNNVFEAARLAGVPRVVFASSIAVYGPQKLFGDRAVTEDDVPLPVWVYGGHKLFNEFMAKKYRERYGMEIVGIRIASSFGFGRVAGFAGWNSQLLGAAAIGRPIRVPLPATQAWPFIYVDDAAELFARVCLAPKVEETVYLTGGETATMEDLAEIAKSLIPDAQIVFDPTASPLPNLFRVDGTRAARAFGFQRRPLREGVVATIEEARGTAGLSAPA